MKKYDLLRSGDSIIRVLEIQDDLEDDEMVELSLRVIVKLNDLTDQEFAEMKFVAAE